MLTPMGHTSHTMRHFWPKARPRLQMETGLMARTPQYSYLGGAFGLCGLLMAFTAQSPLPDPATAVDVWMRARAIIDGESAATEDVSAQVPAAVHLILKFGDRPIASTWAATAAGDTDPVEKATQALLAEAHDDPTLTHTLPSLLTAGLRGTTLEAETAGAFQPILARTLAEATQSLNPATDGIALRVHDHWWVRFPSSLRLTGAVITQSTLHELAAVAGLTPDSMMELRRSGNATLYRFETIDLVQLPNELLPRTYRRGDMHDGWECNRAAVLSQLQLVTQHLASHMQLLQGAGSGERVTVLRGDLLPFTGRYTPPRATRQDQSLFHYAMARANAALGIERTHNLSLAPITTASDDAISAAFQLVMDPKAPAEARTQVQQLLAAPDRRLADRSIAAWALAQTDDDCLLVRAFIEEATLLPPTELIKMLPWLGWADLQLAQASSRPPRLTKLWHVLAAKTAASTNNNAPPTAQFLPVAAFLASITVDDTILPPGERVDFQYSLCRSLELLDMLIIGEDEARFFPNHPAGGVRHSLWNERVSIRAQAMAIMVLTEALGAMPDTVQSEE
jgi:hypothetical protein